MTNEPLPVGRDNYPDTEFKMNKNRQDTPAETIKDFALNVSTAHGFPNIFRSSSRLGRLLWTVIFFAGLGAAIFQGTMLLLKFLSYPVNVEVIIISKPSLEFPSVTVCNTNKLRRSVVDKSRHRQMLVVDQSVSLPYYAPCLEDDFPCSGRPVCIKRYLLCDGIRQCGKDDKSDETNCNYDSATCSEDYFRCVHSGSNVGLCIPKRKKCDRRYDCYEGEDEDDCKCKKSEFKCLKRGGCISKRLVCNGRFDCLDKSDEMDCTTVQCISEPKSIPSSFNCDGFPDCMGGFDERDCSEPPNFDWPAFGVGNGEGSVTDDFQCGADHFNCSSDDCVERHYVCDGYNDCTNGLDESLDVCGRPPICEPPQSPCRDGRGCGVPCDFRPDCPDGTDEMNCECSTFRDINDTTATQIVNCSGTSKVHQGSLADINVSAFRYLITCDADRTSPVLTPYYVCEGNLDCYDAKSLMPEPCKTVYTECYTSPNGRDYKGTMTHDNCLPWSHPKVKTNGYSGRQYWEVEGVAPRSTVKHNFCRNPGGTKTKPWCFVETKNGTLDFRLCDVVPPNNSTCHSATLDIILSHDGNGSFPSQGRLELRSSSGVLGTVSDKFWTVDEANVVCRQLGYPAGALSVTADFSGGTGRVLVKEIRCTGDENYLVDCFYILGRKRDTDHSNDVGVICNTTNAVRRQNLTAVPTDIGAAPTFLDSDDYDKPTFSKPRCGFRCKTGECIQYWQTCNQFPDCPDGSDEWDPELQCDIVTECNLDEFQCRETDRSGDRRCIKKDFVCDNYNDCTDRRMVREGKNRSSDEQRCPLRGESQPDNYYRCTSGKNFIHRYDMCNTEEDCVNGGEDEAKCPSFNQGDEIDPFENPQWYLPYKKLLGKNYRELLDNFTSKYHKKPFDRVKEEDPPDWNGFVTFSATPDYSDLVDVLKLSRDEVRKFGHQKVDFILQCTYEQKKCNMSHIHVIQDDKYGNCFSFNQKDLNIHASKTGSQNGLQMTLFLEQSEYISIYGQEAGVRVSITPTHIRPNPTDIGITVKPGTVTSIGLRYNDVLRKGPPYGKCKATIKNTLIISEGVIRNTTLAEKYDRGLCKKTCVHLHILNYCGCSDTLELNNPRCRLLNTTQDVCKHLIYFLHHNNRLTCNCPQQCSAIYYTKTSSMSMWPSKKFVKLLLRNIHSINNKTKQINEENIHENIARLEIFYEELNYERTKEEPSYQESSLFGDIGGIVGLYIGFSLVTVCEFIGLALKLIKNHCIKSETGL